MSTDDVEPPLSVCALCKSIFRSGFSRCPADGTELELLVEDPFVGQVFAGRYAIEAFAGQGAMGRVYRARHTRMSKRFAVKIMFGDLASDATMRARFQSEAEAASRLDHPNVVSVADFGDTVGGLVYMVMDFVEGMSLARLLDVAGGPLSEARVRVLMRQIAAGLQHAHDRGLVHRDLKTDNVVVIDNEGEEVARIIDFGIAMFADAAPGPAKLTAVGVVIGTPAYMSPEQACGEKLDHRSDLFSLGIMAYEMLAGRKPFDGHPFEMARQNIASTPLPIRERAPLAIVDPVLEAIVFRLMAKNREDRFPSAQALIDALDGRGGDDDVATVKVAPPSADAIARARGVVNLDLSMEQPLAKPRRSPGMATAVVGLLVIGGAAAAFEVWRGGAAVSQPPVASAVLAPAPDPSPNAERSPTPDTVATAPTPVPDPSPVETAVVAIEDDPDEPAEPTRRTSRTTAKRASRTRITLENDEPVSLTLRLAQANNRIERLAASRGPAVAAPFQDRLRRIQTTYAESLRSPSKQQEVGEALDRLQKDLSRY